MDKGDLQFWNDFITMIERSKKSGETPSQFLARTEGEGFFIKIPESEVSDDKLKIDFCRLALASRKEREPIQEFYERLSAEGYGLKFKKPGFDKDKKDMYEAFVKEVIAHLSNEEPIESFISHVEQMGYTLSFSSLSSDRAFFTRVIEYLNDQAGTEYRTSKFPCGSSRLILARKQEGYTWSDFKKVIDQKVKKWRHTEYEEYLRPKTLFEATKFENYVGEKEKTGTATRTGSSFTRFVGSVETAKDAAKALIAKGRGTPPKNSNSAD
jgi:uncharacterized phage protein (TIGR02220 family)